MPFCHAGHGMTEDLHRYRDLNRHPTYGPGRFVIPDKTSQRDGNIITNKEKNQRKPNGNAKQHHFRIRGLLTLSWLAPLPNGFLCSKTETEQRKTMKTPIS